LQWRGLLQDRSKREIRIGASSTVDALETVIEEEQGDVLLLPRSECHRLIETVKQPATGRGAPNPLHAHFRHARRYGGEEFVILLPESDGQQSAVPVAEKIRAHLAAPYLAGGAVVT
jgi:hypothetical protein